MRTTAPGTPAHINPERLAVMTAYYRGILADSQTEAAKAEAAGNSLARAFYDGRLSILTMVLADLAELAGGAA